MKKSVIEKTSEHILNFNQEMDRQLEGQKEFLQQHAEKMKKMSQGENGIRYSKWGVKAGYAVLAGGLVTTLFSPWRGLGVMAVGGVSLLSNFYHIKRLEEKKKKEN